MKHALDISPAWIAVDWGTSNLRVWAMDAGGAILAEAASSDGAGTLARDGFEPALLRLIAPWLGIGVTPVIACGMVGSRQGWAEAPYLTVPTAPRAETLTRANTRDQRFSVQILGGVNQTNPADVMRGEETQIAGLLSAAPDFDGIVCMPGTHTKWVQIVDGELFHFVSFMTGEMFALLSKQSILRHSVADSGIDKAAFLGALDDALTRPERVAAQLFTLRAEGLLNDLAPLAARSRLSGLMVGLELGGAKPYWLGQNVALIGEGRLADLYAQALAHVGIDADMFDATQTVLDGLRAAYTALKTAGELA